MQSENRKERQRGKKKKNKTRLEKVYLRDEESQSQARLGKGMKNQVQLHSQLTMVLRILLGESLKISIIKTTTRNSEKLQQKKTTVKKSVEISYTVSYIW